MSTRSIRRRSIQTSREENDGDASTTEKQNEEESTNAKSDIEQCIVWRETKEFEMNLWTFVSVSEALTCPGCLRCRRRSRFLLNLKKRRCIIEEYSVETYWWFAVVLWVVLVVLGRKVSMKYNRAGTENRLHTVATEEITDQIKSHRSECPDESCNAAVDHISLQHGWHYSRREKWDLGKPIDPLLSQMNGIDSSHSHWLKHNDPFAEMFRCSNTQDRAEGFGFWSHQRSLNASAVLQRMIIGKEKSFVVCMYHDRIPWSTHPSERKRSRHWRMVPVIGHRFRIGIVRICLDQRGEATVQTVPDTCGWQVRGRDRLLRGQPVKYIAAVPMRSNPVDNRSNLSLQCARKTKCESIRIDLRWNKSTEENKIDLQNMIHQKRLELVEKKERRNGLPSEMVSYLKNRQMLGSRSVEGKWNEEESET